MYDIEVMKKDLMMVVSSFRYDHCVMVAEEARKLALHYNIDSQKAYVAGLLHDIAKDFSSEENAKWIRKYNLSEELLSSVFLNIVHADIGALVVKEWYNLEDDICDAIKYHTVGHVPMTMFDKIIFIADKVARKKLDASLDKIRSVAYSDLDKALILCLEKQLEILSNKGLEPSKSSIDLLCYEKELVNFKDY